MRKAVRLVSMLLVMSLLLAVFGCGKASEKSPAPANNTPAAGGGTTAAGGGSDAKSGGAALPISKDKLTFKVLTYTRADMNLGNDMPFYKELEKRTNVSLEWNILPVTNPDEKFHLIMASGEKFDIVIWQKKDDVVKYGTQGAFRPVEDLIKKHAPNIRKLLDAPTTEGIPYQQNIWAELTADDGHVYTIPTLNPSNTIGAVYGIRTDWLQKLNLKVPETTDELYNVLKAFKDKDPNGNGKADEIPYIATADKTLVVLPLINAFGAHMDLYLDAKDNTIKYGPVEPAMKEGLQFVNKLYSEDLIDKEYLSTTRDQWLSKATGNIGGMMFVWPGSGFAASNAGLAKLDKNFRFEPMLPVKGPKGDRFKDTNTVGTYVLYRGSITTSNKHPEETMRYLDYLWSDEGSLLTNYGIEGMHHTKVNGKPRYTDYVLHNPNGKDPETTKVADGLKPVLPWWNTWEPEVEAFKDVAPWTVKSWELYRQKGIVEAPLPGLNFTREEMAARSRLINEIKTFVDEKKDKFIMGVEPLDKFDDFVQQVRKIGLDELLKIYNNAYKRYQSQGKK